MQVTAQEKAIGPQNAPLGVRNAVTSLARKIMLPDILKRRGVLPLLREQFDNLSHIIDFFQLLYHLDNLVHIGFR